MLTLIIAILAWAMEDNDVIPFLFISMIADVFIVAWFFSWLSEKP